MDFIRSDLCDLCLLFVYPLIFNPGGWKGKEEHGSIEGFVFLVFAHKNLGGLCTLWLIFFHPPEGAEAFIIS
jgi:hypothetical protein